MYQRVNIEAERGRLQMTKGEMDAHPAGIITENYDTVFGEPEPG